MRSQGRPWVVWSLGNPATDLPTLGYGRTWSFHGFACTSQRIGLTCRNRSRHGFFLSRALERTF